MLVGEKIKFLLEKNDLKQTDLAKYLSKRTKKEVSANTVNRWIPNENPNKKIYPPSQKYLSLIADYFNVSVDSLLDDDSEIDSLFGITIPTTKSIEKSEAFMNLLKAYDYDMCYGDTEVYIEWKDSEGDTEERSMTSQNFVLFMRHIEKLIKLEIEDYY